MNDRDEINTSFQHPSRFPKNVEGPFYTTGTLSKPQEGSKQPPQWCGDCLWCGPPEHGAPELFAPFDKTYTDTYFIRQSQTPEEVAKAIAATKVCCVNAVRYGGTDRNIIAAMGNNPETCDYIIAPDQSLKLTVGPDGKQLAFAEAMVHEINAKFQNQTKNRRTKPDMDSRQQ